MKLAARLLLVLIACAPVSFADLATLHPSGATVDDTVTYSGGTAATALDSSDGDTSYGLSVDATEDYYLDLDNPTPSGPINSVVVKAVVRRSSAFGSIDFTIGVKTNGSNYFSSSINHANSTYTTYSGDSYATNPQTGVAWTWSEIDNLVAIVNHTDSTDMRVTELYVEVDYISDVTAPDDVTDLATGTVTSSSIDLSWTAPGDDGSTGTATTYDIRYSTSAITAGNWASATQVTGEPAPNVAGTSESFTVTGLSGSTTYFFAIKTADEAPNWSGVSNSPSATTLADTTPPEDVDDLATGTVLATSIELTWTAPGDDDATGTATTYDVRYRTDGPITAGNWATATQATSEPSPSVAGTAESFTVGSLSADTTYWFAIKTADEEPNWSGLSNSPSATTDGTAPAAITDLATTGTPTQIAISLTWTAPGDDGSTGTATSYDVRYSTSTITEGNWASATQATGEPAPQIAGSTEFFTVSGLSPNTLYYFAVKTSDEVPNESALSNVPNDSTASSGGSTAEFHPSGAATGDEMDAYSGGSAATALDTNDGNTSYGRLTDNGSQEGRLDLDDSTQSGTILSVQIKGYFRDADGASDDRIRIGLRTAGTEYWGSIINNVPTSYTLYSGSLYTTNPDTSSPWTWAEIDGLVAMVDNYQSDSKEIRITELYAEVVYEAGDSTAPDAVTDLATGTVTPNSIALSWTAPGDDGSTGTASVYDIRYSTSTITAGNWASAMQATGEPAPSVAGTSESFTVTGLDPETTYYFAIKTRDEVPNISALSNVPSDTTIEGTPPADVTDLATGTVTSSTVDLSWTAPGDDGSSGTATTYDIRYSTSAITAGNWDSATQVTGEPAPSVAGTSESFTVTGLDAGTTYYFAIKTADEVPNWSGVSNSPSGTTTADTTPPEDITDLATGTVEDTSVELTWTAPGDDGATGTATTYDIRYSTSAITAGNWDAATQVTGESAPSVAGTSESFTVTGLSAATQYYFAVKTADEVPNWSGVSNSPNATTDSSDATAPAAITDLATTGTPTQSWIELTWTAPGDDGSVGTADGYDIRYSTSTITEGNWGSATQVTGESSPQAAGSTEYFTVTGLSQNTTYYFAIKTSDEVPNTSALSNVPNDTTASGGGGGDCEVDSTGTYIEAEDFTGTISQGTATFVQESSTAGYNGAGYLRSNGGTTNNPPTEEGKEYLLDFAVSGTYNVWVRGYGPSGSADSVWVGLNGTEVGALTETPDNAWTWTNTVQTGGNQISVPSTGNHKLNIWIRESGHLTDGLYITKGAETPSGGIPSGAKVIDPTSCGGDVTAPATITLATGTVTTTSVALSWTAPGDDGGTGTASAYDIRYSTSTITAGNWGSATQVTGEPTPSVAGSSESYTVTGLDPGTTYYFAIKARDEVPNIGALSNVPSAATDTPPVGGYTADDVIPAGQVSQSTDGLGIVTISWKGRDDETDNVTLNTFEYSVDGGATWNAPTNGDTSAALSTDWDDNGGSDWTTATTFGAATAHSFTLNTQHADLSGLAGVDQSDVRVRFRLDDGTVNSDFPVESEDFQVDNEAPTNTITSGSFSPATDTLTITGTNFLTVADAATDVKGYVDWTKLVWDVNGDDATTADITFVIGDVTSLTVTDDTTLTLVFTAAKALAIETTTDYGPAGGADTLDVTAGFSKDAFGNVATTDGTADAPLTIVAPQLTIVKSSSVISDPINAGTNPKRIPGAVVEYSAIVTNSGNGSPDADSVVVTDALDSATLTYDVTTGVSFTDGTTSSALALGTIEYSQTAAPGPYVYDYTPVPDGDGFDGNVTSIKINTTGTFASGGVPAPSFTLTFRVKVK